MSIKFINDDIFNAKEKYIIDCVDYNDDLNCKSANKFYKKFPNLFDKHKQSISRKTDLDYLLGTVIFHELYINMEFNKTIYGLISISEYIDNELKYFDYKAFFKSLSIVLFDSYIDSDIAIPYKIGCIRSTAEWDRIYEIIEIFSNYFDYDIIIYKK